MYKVKKKKLRGRKETPTLKLTTAESLEKEKIEFLEDCSTKGSEYRSKYRPDWDEIESQINQIPPDSWNDKEDWQTKIYLPLQATGSETAFSKFKKILFSSSHIIDVVGVEKKDKEKVTHLITLMETLLGDLFERENDSLLQEAVDFGSSGMKVLAKPTKDGLIFVNRSVYNFVFDPRCGNDFTKANWAIDEFTKDISELRENPGVYKKEVIEKIFKDAKNDVKINEEPKTKAAQDLTTIKSFDGTQDISIPEAYKIIKLHEWWGKMKIVNKDKNEDANLTRATDYKTEWRVITMAEMGHHKYILRDSVNPYGRVPILMAVLKKRKFDTYGKGYLRNGRGLQDLGNSMINLGFDSEKINSFDILGLDVNAVSDWNTIKYRPRAVWSLNNVNGVKSFRASPVSALVEIVTKGIPFIDQLYQDVTSLTRHAQGSMPLSGGSEAETLGEYQMKMQSIDDKFLSQAKVLEASYCKPLFSLIYKIITSKELFTQKACDRILGVNKKIIEQPMIDLQTGQPIINPQTGQPMISETVQRTPKLNLAELDPTMSLDFRLIGVTQLQEVLEVKAQLMQVIQLATQIPQFANYFKPYGLLKSIIQSMRVQDVDDIIKTEKELEEEQKGVIPQYQQIIQAMAMVLERNGMKVPPEIAQAIAMLQQQQTQPLQAQPQPIQGGA